MSPILPSAGPSARPLNLEVDVARIHGEVLQGLRKPQKELPSKLFYDEVGSQLFEQICDLDEYYLTRTETAIMQASIGEIAALLGKGCLLIEYGSGNSKKTRILLDHLPELVAYLAIDISKEHLLRSAADLAAAYPGLDVIPIWADYTSYFVLPVIHKPVVRKIAYFPGSTIGNFYPGEAVAFLERIAGTIGPSGALLIGVDLKKDPEALNLAYNDRAGVTAAFNLNLLARLNREFGADFQLEQFAHHAFYNEAEGRIEMHLISLREQTVHMDGQEIRFEQGETILSEVSYKYTLEEFARLAAQAGFKVGRVWTDEDARFSVQYLIALNGLSKESRKFPASSPVG